MFEDLKLRTLSALVLLLILFLITVIAPFLLTPSLYILNVLFLRELFRLFSFKKEPSIFNLILLAVCIFPLYFSKDFLLMTFFLNGCLFFLIFYLSKSMGLGFFIVYVNLSISFLLNLLVSSTELGGENFFFVLVLLVAFADMGGYFGGRIIGGPKVFERISPNKTWAGIFLGWITVITFYYILKAFNLFVSDFFVFVFFGIALSSQVGDFIESYIKRNLGVKDTGNIIPGHGGLLDRFDGLICASFFVKIIDFFLTT